MVSLRFLVEKVLSKCLRALRGKTVLGGALRGWLVGAGGVVSGADALEMLGQGSGAASRVYRCWGWLLCPSEAVLSIFRTPLQIEPDIFSGLTG